MTRAKDAEKTYNLQTWYFTVAVYQFSAWLDWYANYTGDRELAEKVKGEIAEIKRKADERTSQN